MSDKKDTKAKEAEAPKAPKASGDLTAAQYASGALNRVLDPKVGHLTDAK